MDGGLLYKPLNFENESEIKNEYKQEVMGDHRAFYLPVLHVLDRT
jgi:hypothetical protein